MVISLFQLGLVWLIIHCNAQAGHGYLFCHFLVPSRFGMIIYLVPSRFGMVIYLVTPRFSIVIYIVLPRFVMVIYLVLGLVWFYTL